GFNNGGVAPPNAGRILEFTYIGNVLAINDTVNSHERNTSIEIYPNPANNFINIKSLRNISKPLYYDLYDVTGKLLLKGKSKNDLFKVNVENLAPGMYILKLYNSFRVNVSTQKIIVRK